MTEPQGNAIFTRACEVGNAHELLAAARGCALS